MKKLFVLSGAVITGIIMAAAVILHSQSGADDLFEENVEVLARAAGPDDPAVIEIPCYPLNGRLCAYPIFGRGPEGELLHIRDRIEQDMIYTGGGAS